MLFWQLLQKAQTLFWQLLQKAQYYVGPMSLWQHFIKNPKLLDKQLFYQSPIIIWQKNCIMLKAQNYSLAKTYVDILNSLTHGKHKLLMKYYPSFKTISSTRFMGIILIFFHKLF